MAETSASPTGKVPPKMALCQHCRRFVHQHEAMCPFCGSDYRALEIERIEKAQAAKQVAQRLQRLLSDL